MSIERLQKELQIAKESFSTAYDLESGSRDLFFPENVNGLRILDIGGGASTITLDLQAKGAQTVAIDYIYANLKKLKTSVDRTLTGTSHLRENKAYIDDQINQLKKTESPKVRRYISQLVQDSERDFKNSMKRFRKNRDRFFQAVENHSVPVLAAFATCLPFKDNTFDITFSAAAISSFLIHDPDVLEASILEGSRVTKPGGVFQVYPWFVDDKEEENFTNAKNVEKKLKESGLDFHLLYGPNNIAPTLVIKKD